MTSQKWRGGPKRAAYHLSPPRKTNAEPGGRWEQKNMWVALARGAFIYGAHMTRNITANNTTNTQTLVTLPGQKKLPNKCHTNHPVVVKPLSKQVTQFGLLHFRGRRVSIRKKTHPSSLFLHLSEEERSKTTSCTRNIFYFLKLCVFSAPTEPSVQ